MHATTFLADRNGLTPSGNALLESLRATPSEPHHRSCSLSGATLHLNEPDKFCDPTAAMSRAARNGRKGKAAVEGALGR